MNARMWVTSRSWCPSGLFRPKYNVKNKGFELKLTEKGGTIQYILFPGIKLTL